MQESKQSRNNSKSLEISCNITNGVHYRLPITDDDAGEIICNNCGVVLEEKTLSYKINEKEEIGF